jgi:hypothetical protein
VHDLVADIDRGAVFAQRQLDDLNRPLDPGAEAPGLGENDLHEPVVSHNRRAVTPFGGVDRTRCYVYVTTLNLVE